MEESSLCDYMVGDIIGEGSFATVYHGIHKETSRDVAIKLFDKASLQKHPEWLQAVLMEQRILRKLVDCPFVASLLASFHDDQFVYLVLEFYNRGTLAQYLKQKSKMEDHVWLSHAVAIALGIGAAIQAIHGYNVIHADLKPDNLLLTNDLHKIVVTDFGSALSTDVSGNVLLRGTAEYAAPELIRGTSTPTTAVDLWSFGCLLHTLWTGESPFHADSEALIVDKVVAYAKSGDCKAFGTRIPPTVLDLIQHLLDPVPQKRTCCSFDYIKSVLKSTDEYKNKPFSNDDFPDSAWAHGNAESAMKDGNLGWRIFL